MLVAALMLGLSNPAWADFQALCMESLHDVHWKGPLRRTREEAQRDVDVHLQRFPRHYVRVIVVEKDTPDGPLDSISVLTDVREFDFDREGSPSRDVLRGIEGRAESELLDEIEDSRQRQRTQPGEVRL
jgi:hypothetical protein